MPKPHAKVFAQGLYQQKSVTELTLENAVQYLFRSPVFCPFGKVMHEKGTGRVRINGIKVGVGFMETLPLVIS